MKIKKYNSGNYKILVKGNINYHIVKMETKKIANGTKYDVWQIFDTEYNLIKSSFSFEDCKNYATNLANN